MPGPAKKSRPRKAKSAATSGNRSVIVAAEVLKTLARFGEPAALGQIAAAAGLSSSRVHRYLSSLVQTGLVEQNAGTGQYELGPTAVELGLIAIGQIDPIKFGIEILPRLTKETGLVSLLSVWGSHGPTIVKWESGQLDTSVHIREGRTLPLLTTATGRVYLAYAEIKRWQKVVRQELASLKKQTGKTPKVRETNIEAMRKEVLKHGLGRMVGEENPGLAALSAPVFDRHNQVALSLTVISILGTFDDSYDGDAANILKATAKQLSRRLGAQRPDLRNDESISAPGRKLRYAAE